MKKNNCWEINIFSFQLNMSETKKRSRSHWGKIEEESLNLNLPSETTTKHDKTKSAWNTFEIPPLYQPCAPHRTPKKEKPNKNLTWMKPPVDEHEQNFVYQSIELQHFKRRMRYMLSAAQSHQNEQLQKGSNVDSPVLPSPPIPPKRFCSSEGRLITRTQPGFMGGEFSAHDIMPENSRLDPKNFKCPLELDTVASRQLMYKAVAAGTAHAGFELATETSLNTLTDVVGEFSMKLCCALKCHMEQHRGATDVVDGLSHVLKQHTSGDLLSLKEFWVTRVKNVALKMEKEGMLLLEEYNALKESSVQRVEVKQECK